MNKILLSLGYRKIGTNRMAKSIGHLILIYFLDTNRLGYYFYGNGIIKELLCWSSKILNTDDLLNDIISFEEYNRPAACTGKYTNFSFLTLEQQMEDLF